ncbi:Uncharacterised protein [Corynebacterium diphtheriae]|nr:Uncharacterised protein [Corynebacterium diphtheriae]
MSNTILELDQLLSDVEMLEADSVEQSAVVDVDDVDYELRMGSTIATIVVKC